MSGARPLFTGLSRSIGYLQGARWRVVVKGWAPLAATSRRGLRWGMLGQLQRARSLVPAAVGAAVAPAGTPVPARVEAQAQQLGQAGAVLRQLDEVPSNRLVLLARARRGLGEGGRLPGPRVRPVQLVGGLGAQRAWPVGAEGSGRQRVGDSCTTPQGAAACSPSHGDRSPTPAHPRRMGSPRGLGCLRPGREGYPRWCPPWACRSCLRSIGARRGVSGVQGQSAARRRCKGGRRRRLPRPHLCGAPATLLAARLQRDGCGPQRRRRPCTREGPGTKGRDNQTCASIPQRSGAARRAMAGVTEAGWSAGASIAALVPTNAAWDGAAAFAAALHHCMPHSHAATWHPAPPGALWILWHS